jgi:hypothetical protein
MGEAKRRKQAGGPGHANWRTRIDAAAEAYYGVAEAHGVFFQPISDRGGPIGNTVVVSIPETPDAKITGALALAMRTNARMAFLCDTRNQAEAIAGRAGAALPTHRRVAYERAEAGAWGLA